MRVSVKQLHKVVTFNPTDKLLSGQSLGLLYTDDKLDSQSYLRKYMGHRGDWSESLYE